MNISHASCVLHTGDWDHTAVSRHLDCNDGAAPCNHHHTPAITTTTAGTGAQDYRNTGCQGQKLDWWNDRLLLLMLGTWVSDNQARSRARPVAFLRPKYVAARNWWPVACWLMKLTFYFCMKSHKMTCRSRVGGCWKRRSFAGGRGGSWWRRK